MSAAQGHGSGLPVGGAAGLCSCGLAPQTATLPRLRCSFPPLCLSFHCLLYLPLNSHLPSLTAGTATGTAASTKGHHPRAWSPSHLPGETCLWLCSRPAAVANASLRSGTRCFLFSSLYLHKLQVCLFLMEVPGWYMYVINIWM